ncbi:hypothetical protein C8Q74DRAFT_1247829 [Fomes fomentarius]|nr:hypothetical protein C8Q74DRAFT_1247829 [Fomes fomentarius]
MKFEMELPITVLTKRLEKLAAKFPLKAWAVACRLRLESIAHIAAERLSLMKFEIKGSKELDGVCAGEYFRLLEYLRLKRRIPEDFKFLDPSLSPPDASASLESPTVPHAPQVLVETPSPDIICRSCDDVEFHAHQTVLSLASPVLQERIGELVHNDTTKSPILPLEEDSSILSIMLKLCYPNLSHDVIHPADPSRFMFLLVSLKKYGMDPALTSVRGAWLAIAASDALRAYCAAIRAGDADCAKEAARCALETNFESVYVPEMEAIPAIAYHRLLTYYDACRRLAITNLAEIATSATSSITSAMVAPLKQDAEPPILEHGAAILVATSAPAPAAPLSPANKKIKDNLKRNGKKEKEHNAHWIETYIKDLQTKYQARPGTPGPTIGVLFVDATKMSPVGVWCPKCQVVANNLISLHEGIQRHISALNQVSDLMSIRNTRANLTSALTGKPDCS